MISKFKLKKKQKNKKKKGFTLVELLAVIVILAVIMVITIPTVIGSMNSAKEKSEEIFIASIERSLNKFIENELQYADYNFETPKNEYVVEDITGKYKVSKVLKKDEAGNNVAITFNDLDELGFFHKDDLVNPKDESICNENENPTVEIYKDKINSNKYYYYLDLDCLNEPLTNLPLPEEPDLSGGLIPVIYDASKKESTGWFVADPTTEWYNYDNQEWANAVAVLNNERYAPDGIIKPFDDDGKPNEIQQEDLLAMFVWIPRFSYTIGCTDVNGDNTEDCLGYKIEGARNLQVGNNGTKIPGAIDIRFITTGIKHTLKDNELPQYSYTNSNDRKPKNWITHPAFQFGDTQLSGIWIGKFETTGEQNKPTILPLIKSLAPNNFKNGFTVARMFSDNNNIYGIKNGNSHMSKNVEWSSVLYLYQSKYGKYGNEQYMEKNKLIYLNNNSNYITGVSCGAFNCSSSSTITCSYDDIGENRTEGTGLCGPGASTTGNIYGVYDMFGGAPDLVSATYNFEQKYNTPYGFDFNFKNDISNKKYFDNYEDSNLYKVDYFGHGLFEFYFWNNKNGYSNVSFGSDYNYYKISRGGKYDADFSYGPFIFNLTNIRNSIRVVYIPSVDFN